MSPETLAPQLQLALGGVAVLDEERPAVGGRRCFLAHAPVGGRRLLVTLHAAPPEGPSATALQAKVARFKELGHASVLLPVASGEINGRAWVVDAEDGLLTLAHRLRERGPLPVKDAVRALRDLARALAAMHRRGLVHGALSVETVLLAPEGTLLTGLAFEAGGNEGDDLDALAMVARALFYGERPDRNSLGRRLPPELQALLDSMATDDPSRRARRAEAVLGVLDTFPVGQSSSLGSVLDSAGRGARERGRKATMAVLAIVGLIALAAWWLASHR